MQALFSHPVEIFTAYIYIERERENILKYYTCMHVDFWSLDILTRWLQAEKPFSN